MMMQCKNISVSWVELIPIGPRREQVNDYRMLFISSSSMLYIFSFLFSWMVSEGDVEGLMSLVTRDWRSSAVAVRYEG